MKDEQQIRKLLVRYLSNQSTESEIRELTLLLNSHAGMALLREVMDEESRKLDHSQHAIPPDVTSRMYDRLMESVTQKERPSIRKAFTVHPLYSQMAAAFIGLLLVTGMGYRILNKHTSQTYHTESGQKRTILLPDGSRIILNSNSWLTYTPGWPGVDARRVELEGEAFFDIAHDERRPFYVKTARAEIKVLGTAFNVKTSKRTNTFETTLIRGKVTVRDLDSPNVQATLLKPNERVVLGRGGGRPQTSTVQLQSDSYWQKGRLVFEDEPFGIIAQELETWYKVKIELDEASKNCRFHLNIENETLPEVLRLFEETTDVQVVMNGNRVVLKGRLCDEN